MILHFGPERIMHQRRASVDIGDVVFVLEFLFREGPAPGGVDRCIRVVG